MRRRPTGTSTICVSVPRIAPRVATKLPPDVIPLGSVVPGLRLPIAIVTRAQAKVRVDEQRSRKSRPVHVPGLGPRGRAARRTHADRHPGRSPRVDRGADEGVRFARRQAPPGPAEAHPARRRLRLRPADRQAVRAAPGPHRRQPRATQPPRARPVPAGGGARRARPPSRSRRSRAPGSRRARRRLRPRPYPLRRARRRRVQLSANPILVPADKSTVKTLLVLGGNLQLAAGAVREAEYEQPESESPEAFAELQPELAPFV